MNKDLSKYKCVLLIGETIEAIYVNGKLIRSEYHIFKNDYLKFFEFIHEYGLINPKGFFQRELDTDEEIYVRDRGFPKNLSDFLPNVKVYLATLALMGDLEQKRNDIELPF